MKVVVKYRLANSTMFPYIAEVTHAGFTYTGAGTSWEDAKSRVLGKVVNGVKNAERTRDPEEVEIEIP